MAIDVTRVLDLFKTANFEAVVTEYAPVDLFYKNYFPSEYTPTLTFEALQANFGAKVAADVVAFDSRAPRKGRQTPGKITGDIPKVEIARVKKESDLNTYRMLQDAAARIGGGGQSRAVANRIVQFLYGDAEFVLDGINARMEWLAKQVASTGTLKLTIANNEGGVQTAADIDFGIPGANIVNRNVAWATAATATPIADIKARQDAARAKGYRLNFAFTDPTTFSYMQQTAEVQKYTASFANNALGLQQVPTQQTINAALAAQGLPQFIIWDSYVNLESKAGVLGSTSGWEPGRVVFSATSQLGVTANTTTADEWVNIDDSVKAVNDFIVVKTFAEQDPITVITKAAAYAVPVLNGASQLHILKTV